MALLEMGPGKLSLSWAKDSEGESSKACEPFRPCALQWLPASPHLSPKLLERRDGDARTVKESQVFPYPGDGPLGVGPGSLSLSWSKDPLAKRAKADEPFIPSASRWSAARPRSPIAAQGFDVDSRLPAPEEGPKVEPAPRFLRARSWACSPHPAPRTEPLFPIAAHPVLASTSLAICDHSLASRGSEYVQLPSAPSLSFMSSLLAPNQRPTFMLGLLAPPTRQQFTADLSPVALSILHDDSAQALRPSDPSLLVEYDHLIGALVQASVSPGTLKKNLLARRRWIQFTAAWDTAHCRSTHGAAS